LSRSKESRLIAGFLNFSLLLKKRAILENISVPLQLFESAVRLIV